MKIELLSAVVASILLSVTGVVFAGPGGKDGVAIEHVTSKKKEDVFVDIEVSVPGAIAHLGNHEEDCMQVGNNPEAENEVALALGLAPADLSCGGDGGGYEEE